MIRDIATARKQTEPAPNPSTCKHRTVAKDRRIVCSKIVQGEAQVSPGACCLCPFKAINCAHIRFSLEQTEAHRTAVRYNGKTEVWDNEPPEIRFKHAVCAAKAAPIHHPRQCTGCTLRQPATDPAPHPAQSRTVEDKIMQFPQQRQGRQT